MQLQFSNGVLRQIQHWKNDQAQLHVARGGKVILSPSSRLYLDIQVRQHPVLGLRWAGLIPLRHAYDWEPATFRQAIPDSAILGVEGPLWSETVEHREIRIPRVSPAAGDRGTGMVPVSSAELGRIPAPAREPRRATHGAPCELLPHAGSRLAPRIGRSALARRVVGTRHADASLNGASTTSVRIASYPGTL